MHHDVECSAPIKPHNLAHSTRADLLNDAVMRQSCVVLKFFIHLLLDSFRQIHPFQQILEARVIAERFKLHLPSDFH